MSATREQRHRALDRANHVRFARAELKRRIASGELAAAEIILRPPAEAVNWPTGQVVMSQRRWGRSRTVKLLSRNMISELKPIGKLSERQRKMLAAQLAGRRTGSEGVGVR